MNETMAALLQNWDTSVNQHKMFKQLIGYKDEKTLFKGRQE